MANSNDGGCLGKLIGWAVMVAVVVVMAKSCGFGLFDGGTRFGCEAAGSAGPVVYAASDDCPSSIEDAATNARWAANRIAEIAGEHDTTGVLYDSDGHSTTFTSNESDDAFQLALEYLSPILGGESYAKQAAGHVETKAAAAIRQRDQTFAVLVINHTKGPCDWASRLGCQQLVPLMLPTGTTLVVWSPGGKRMQFSGEADS